jgi:hypothetical protein
VRWLLLFVGAFGCVGACAGFLGIESPSEQRAPDDGGVPDVDGTVPEGAAGDAPPLEDATPVGADVAEGSDDDALPDVSPLPTPGIPCGNTTCFSPLACCYTSPLRSIGCQSMPDCMQNAGSAVLCDGAEDCPMGQVCCGGTLPFGGFVAICAAQMNCKQATACHPATDPCDCKSPTNACLPFRTCDGRCT